ncbi:MAG: SGNH/GDSL hydrolase family protein [Pirellulaceae bacterium]|nr:SGNH/GDSL hydrolase family protein [Pirellulaceae bacterium]
MLLKLLVLALVYCLASDETVLSLGDSYTIGEGVAADERWPVQMVKELNDRGETFATPQIIAKTGWTTDELQAGIKEQELAEKYDWVTLLIGVNNQYRQRDVDEYRQQFRELLKLAIEKADQNPQRVIVLSIPDWGVTPFATQRGRDPEVIAKQIDQFNQIAREETELLKAHYIDITKLTREAADQPEKYLVADQLHPSAEMYRQWAKLAADVILAPETDHEPNASAVSRRGDFQQIQGGQQICNPIRPISAVLRKRGWQRNGWQRNKFRMQLPGETSWSVYGCF